MKAGCGKTARPVWAADEGQRSGSRAFSDPTPMKPGNAGGGKGPQFKDDAARRRVRRVA